jgi:MYXO-CTERM domain-containing protein
MRVNAFASAVALAGLGLSVSPVAAAVEYKYDDGSANVRTTTTFAAEMLWGNLYQAQPGGTVINQIGVGFGRLATGTPIRLWVFDDPNDDWDPTDAVLLSQSTALSGTASIAVINLYNIAPVTVSGVFFVAVSAFTDGGINAVPARLDPDGAAVASRSWLFAASNINPNALGDSPFIRTMAQNVPQGTFVVRATGVPTPASAGLLALAGLAAVRRRR